MRHPALIAQENPNAKTDITLRTNRFMIAYVQGEVTEKTPAAVVLDVHGIGYRLLIPLCTYDRLPAVGESCRLLTHHHVREDAHLLFGFSSGAERDLFEMLIEVSGIGPRVALNLLSSMRVAEIRAAIAEGDVKRLCRAQGIGRKTAERMVLELRERIDPSEGLTAGSDTDTAEAPILRDVLLALTALGFSPEQARARVKPLLDDALLKTADTETLIKRALAGR